MDLVRLDPEEKRPNFDCNDDDLNEFYHVDSKEGARQLLSVTYTIVDDHGTTIAYFSVSNDAIKKADLPSKSRFKKIVEMVPFVKRYSSMPAAKIGRLAVCTDQVGNGIGTMVLDYLKYWFTHGNKTGCRFLLVDAYNTEKVTNFYKKNGFRFLTSEGKDDPTRIMYFDLMLFRE